MPVVAGKATVCSGGSEVSVQLLDGRTSRVSTRRLQFHRKIGCGEGAATVDMQKLPGDEPCFLGTQQGDDVSHISRGGQPPHRNPAALKRVATWTATSTLALSRLKRLGRGERQSPGYPRSPPVP